jgi:hypothetical protein
MEGLEEVAAAQLVAQPLVGGVVIQQDPEQRLFRLDVGRQVLRRRVGRDRT